MASQASIKVIKSFNYRGTARTFSNRYHFTNDAPTTPTRWTTFSDAVTAAEKAIFTLFSQQGATIIETVGYAAGSEVPVFSKTYSLDGTETLSLAGYPPGDTAALVRYSTADRSTKNHPIYLFNYYHGMHTVGGSGTQDSWNAGERTAASTYATSWITGFSDGTVNHVRCSPNGAVATGFIAEALLTHRDLPR